MWQNYHIQYLHYFCNKSYLYEKYLVPAKFCEKALANVYEKVEKLDAVKY